MDHFAAKRPNTAEVSMVLTNPLKKSFLAMFIELIDHPTYFSRLQSLEESGKRTLSSALDNISQSLSALKSQHEAELDGFVGLAKEDLKRSLIVNESDLTL
jgi:hypothetical protein